MNRRPLLVIPLFLAVSGASGFFAGRAGGEKPVPPPPDTPRPIAWVRQASGPVVAGTSGVSASSRTPLAARTRLETDPGARAVVDLREAGTLVVGAKAALQVLEESWDGADLDATRVRFFQGTLRAQAGADVDGLVIDLGDQRVEVAPGGEALLSWDGEVLALSFLRAGGIVYMNDGHEEIVPSGKGVRLARGDSQVRPVALPPALTSLPTLGDTVYAQDGTARPKFRFPGEAGAVRVVVSRDEAQTDVAAEAEGDAKVVELGDELPPGRYFWSAARVDPATKLSGPPTPPRPFDVVSRERPAPTDDAPASAVVASGPLTRVFFSGAEPPRISLDWAGKQEELGYTVLVGRDAKLKKPEMRSVVEKSALDLGAITPGTWYWKVTGASVTQSGRLVVKKASGTAVRATRVTKVDEEFDQAQVYFQREPPAVEFSWKEDARASNYRLVLARNQSFSPVLLSREAKAPPVLLEAGLLPEGDLRWRVQRLKADGSVFYPGKIQVLTVKSDLENPDLELAQPAEGAPVVGGKVEVRGLAPREAALWVNGTALVTDRRGQFSIEVAVDPVNPVVIVKSVRAGNDLSYFVRTLSAPAPTP